jgi:hypothetical protein
MDRSSLARCSRWWPVLAAARHEGIPIIDARGQAWRARRDRARFLGEKFDEQPPYDMTPFRMSNEP